MATLLESARRQLRLIPEHPSFLSGGQSGEVTGHGLPVHIIIIVCKYMKYVQTRGHIVLAQRRLKNTGAILSLAYLPISILRCDNTRNQAMDRHN